MDVKIITYVLDDDREELLLMEPFLRKVCGCNFSLHSDINEFIKAIEQGVHIAIIDYRLNAMVDGISVGQLVLEKNRLCYLIMFSGSDNKETVVRAMNTGFRAYVDKNDRDAYAKVAAFVSLQLKEIRNRISIYEKYSNLVASAI